jgi:hypothetical protein
MANPMVIHRPERIQFVFNLRVTKSASVSFQARSSFAFFLTDLKIVHHISNGRMLPFDDFFLKKRSVIAIKNASGYLSNRLWPMENVVAICSMNTLLSL